MYLTYLKSAVSYACCLFGDLVIYDLPDSAGAPKRQRRLHKLLSGYRMWTQYSVFECFLTAVQFVKLQQQVEQLIKPVEDSVLMFWIRAGVKRTITYGSQQPREERAIVF